MQVLKPEVRNRIVKAAEKSFRKYGYTKTDMRSISEAAGITVGNIYRYYRNKENLFEHIVTKLDLSGDYQLAAMMKAARGLDVFGPQNVLERFSFTELDSIAKGKGI